QYFTGFAIADRGANGNFEDEIRRISSTLGGTLAVAAGLRLVRMLVAKIEERVDVGIGKKDHRTPAAAIAAIRAAAGHIFFPAECGNTVAAGSSLYFNFDFIYKHCGLFVMGQ